MIVVDHQSSRIHVLPWIHVPNLPSPIPLAALELRKMSDGGPTLKYPFKLQRRTAPVVPGMSEARVVPVRSPAPD